MRNPAEWEKIFGTSTVSISTLSQNKQRGVEKQETGRPEKGNNSALSHQKEKRKWGKVTGGVTSPKDPDWVAADAS